MRNSQRSKNFSIGKVGLNINGDLSEKEIKEIVNIAEKAGIRIVWIGEFEGFEDPFNVAELIGSCSNLYIGFGVLSAQKGWKRIVSGVEGLRERYGDRFIVGIGAGNCINPKEGYRKLKKCLDFLKDFDFPVVIGAGSPMTAKLSREADGVLFNSVKEEYIKWLLRYANTPFKAAYGPALILPSKNEEDLLIAAAIVFTGSRKLIEEFQLESVAEELLEVDIMSLVRKRREGGSIAECREAEVLFRHGDFLLSNFTISGSVESVKARINSLLQLCDHVVLADPFFRDIESVKSLKVVLV